MIQASYGRKSQDYFTGFELALLQYAMKLTERPCHVQQVRVDYLTYAGMDDEQILKARPIIFYFNYVNRSINESGVTMKATLQDITKMINAITIIKKKQGLTYEKFQNYWKNEHAKIVTRSPFVGTYVQSHPIYNDKLTFEDTIDGIAEIWFDDTNAMRSLAATKEYKDIQDDEKVFIDGSAVRLIIAEDIITVEGNVSDYKLIILSLIHI